jgi:hypothetical protein
MCKAREQLQAMCQHDEVSSNPLAAQRLCGNAETFQDFVCAGTGIRAFQVRDAMNEIA